MTWPILKKPGSPRVFSLAAWRELSSSLNPFSSLFVDPSLIRSSVLFVSSPPQGLQRIHPRRGESRPLSLSQARGKEGERWKRGTSPLLVPALMSTQVRISPVLEPPPCTTSGRKRGCAWCIRMFLQLTRALCVLITAERALKERHHLRSPCKWATPRKIARVSCQRHFPSSACFPHSFCSEVSFPWATLHEIWKAQLRSIEIKTKP